MKYKLFWVYVKIWSEKGKTAEYLTQLDFLARNGCRGDETLGSPTEGTVDRARD